MRLLNLIIYPIRRYIDLCLYVNRRFKSNPYPFFIFLTLLVGGIPAIIAKILHPTIPFSYTVLVLYTLGMPLVLSFVGYRLKDMIDTFNNE